jgi:hypothetical protein
MRTTLVIDDDLYRRVKAKAAMEGRKVTELVEDGLRAALGLGPARLDESHGPRRVALPLIPARRGAPALMAGMTQEEIHRRLAELQLEDDRAHAASSP